MLHECFFTAAPSWLRAATTMLEGENEHCSKQLVTSLLFLHLLTCIRPPNCLRHRNEVKNTQHASCSGRIFNRDSNQKYVWTDRNKWRLTQLTYFYYFLVVLLFSLCSTGVGCNDGTTVGQVLVSLSILENFCYISLNYWKRFWTVFI